MHWRRDLNKLGASIYSYLAQPILHNVELSGSLPCVSGFPPLNLLVPQIFEYPDKLSDVTASEKD